MQNQKVGKWSAFVGMVGNRPLQRPKYSAIGLTCSVQPLKEKYHRFARSVAVHQKFARSAVTLRRYALKNARPLLAARPGRLRPSAAPNQRPGRPVKLVLSVGRAPLLPAITVLKTALAAMKVLPLIGGLTVPAEEAVAIVEADLVPPEAIAAEGILVEVEEAAKHSF
jgi:hypothetical protein